MDNQTPKISFAITSAINTKFGIYTADQRLQQTIDTMKSIREKVPTAQIIILESGNRAISAEQFSSLSKYANYIIDFTNEEDVKQIHTTINNHDVVKNTTEMLCFIKFLKIAVDNKLFDGIERIFKMSGRYQLNDNFDINFYNDKSRKIVVKEKLKSQFPLATTLIEHQYMTRLWSFDTSMVSDIIDKYTDMLQYSVDRLNNNGYADIEHCLYKFLDSNTVVEVQTIGVSGNIAPNGFRVED